MPVLSLQQATNQLATAVERARPADLEQIYAEIFPEHVAAPTPTAHELAAIIRSGLEAEELVDLWNVVFPLDANVWFNEETEQIHLNEELAGVADED
jgi:hypothetical protein